MPKHYLEVLTVKKVHEKGRLGHQSLDLMGTIFSIVGLSGIIYGINGEAYRGISIVIGLIFLVLFIWQESRAKVPMMPLKLFSSPVRTGAYISRFFFTGVSFTFLYIAPQAMQNVYHLSPFKSSLMFLFMNIPQFIAATFVPRLVARFSNAKVALLATVFDSISFAWMVIAGVQRGYWFALAIPMVIFGIGQGLIVSPLTSLGIADTTLDIAGSASGVVNTFHQTGQSVGLAIVIAFTSSLSPFATVFNTAMIILMLYSLVSLVANAYLTWITK